MQAICRRMFFNSLRNTGAVDWEDVYQEAALKLWQTIASAQPTTPREYFMLATKKIREVSLDLCRKFAREVVPFEGDAEKSFNPLTSAKWTEFHEQVQKLDEKHREVFELLWYHELTQQEVADMLGVDVSTIKTRWRSARASLAEFAP